MATKKTTTTNKTTSKTVKTATAKTEVTAPPAAAPAAAKPAETAPKQKAAPMKTATAKADTTPVVKAKAEAKSSNGKKPVITSEQRYQLICEEAYYISQKRNGSGEGDPATDWLQAEKSIDERYTVAAP